MTPAGGVPEPGEPRLEERNGPPAVPVPESGIAAAPDQSGPAPRPNAIPPAPPQPGWLEKAAAIVYCIFCIEIGLFLLIYPWMASWDRNYLVQIKPSLTGLLTSVQFRGAVSGLGILNLLAALSEILALRRYSSR